MFKKLARENVPEFLYRYEEINLLKIVKDFCKKISKYENNKFIVIELLNNDSCYFNLESNHGPGWSIYNHISKFKFANQLFKKLIKEKNE